MRKKHRHQGLFGLFFIVLILLSAGCTWNRWNMKEKVVDYWEEQSANYTSITRELTAGTILENIEYVESISQDKYAYQGLDDETKQVYDEVLNAILAHTDKIVVATKDPEVLRQAFECVFTDYGGLFWVSGYSYTEYTRNKELVSIEFEPRYTMDYEERKKMQEQIDMAVEDFLQGISTTDSDYDKAKYIFENLIMQVDYDVEAENSQNIISVFVGKKTVCQGYASATLYLLNQLNIPGVIVTGSANGGAHAWNMVLLDGEYYFMDTTWGNSTYLDKDSQTSKFVNYSYMAFDTETMEFTHTPDDHIPLPQCIALEDNFFVKEGLYFTEWKPDEIGDLYGEASYNESGRVSIRYGSDELYNKAKTYFIEQQRLEEYCDLSGYVFYLEDTKQRILTISIQK